jgi:hypothetical protein
MKLTRQQKQIIDAGTTIALEQPTDQDKALLAASLCKPPCLMPTLTT